AGRAGTYRNDGRVVSLSALWLGPHSDFHWGQAAARRPVSVADACGAGRGGRAAAGLHSGVAAVA
nr:hypothetical protein [Tanacetum cinerariifolium]